MDKASAVVVPYYNTGRENILYTYSTHVKPAYEASRPYIERTYVMGHKAVVETGYPYAKWLWLSSLTFVNRTIWPQVRILYGENVEPQLLRISERLGRYRDGQKLKAVLDEVDAYVDPNTLSLAGRYFQNLLTMRLSSEEEPTISSTSSSSVSSVVASSAVETMPSEVSEPAPPAEPSTEEQEAQVRQKIAKDLETWQEKFSKAADKGAEDLGQRIHNLTDQQLKSQVQGVGEAFVVRLEETTSSETKKLKNAINSIVIALPEELVENDIKGAEDQVVKAVRAAGLSIKTDAQSLRSWKQNIIKETQSLVSAAAGSTLEVLDNIRDLGLQEIGMRWAWMDGVTYKDWATYHEIKKTFDEWRHKVETVAIEHDGFLSVKSAAEDVEGRGMAIAEDAAKELSRLKEVGLWKVQAVDDSDDFATRTVPAAAVLAGKRVASKINSASESVVGTSQGNIIESIVAEATQRGADALLAASSKVIGTDPNIAEQAVTKVSEAVLGTTTAYHESVISAAKEKVSEASEHVSRSIVGSSTPVTENIVSSAKSIASDLSGAIKGTPQPKAESVVSVVSERVEHATIAASEAILGTSAPAHESVLSEASKGFEEGSSSVSSVVSVASQKVFAGAMAQNVRERVPVFEDVIEEDDSYPEKLQNVLSNAGSKYADITKAVSEALIRPTSTQGSVESITSLAEEQYSSALAAASSVLYGTEPGTGEMISKAASDKYAQAVAA